MSQLPRTRVRPSPNKAKSPRRRPCLALDSDDEARYIVTVRSAKNLKREGFRGLTNPYCQLMVGRQGPFTTDVVFDSTNPSWKHKRQTFEFREGKGPAEDKLSLACFNSGEVPELIGRLSVALSPATHKVISLPMFRKDRGGSQVWAGSVEMELHYKPDGECASPVNRGNGVKDTSSGVKDTSSGVKETNGGGFPPLSPCSTSLASSFVKAALLFPEKASKVGGGGAVQADLLALSPRVAKEAEAAALLTRSRGQGNGGGGGGVDVGDGGGGGVKCLDGGSVGKVVAAKGAGGGERRRMWRSFFAGVVCSAVLLVGALWALGDPFVAARLGMSMSVLEGGGPGRQTFIVISGSKISRLADRHLVVLVGDQEVCRGGVPAPSPPTEGSGWAYDLSSTEKAAAACVGGGGGGGGGGRTGCASVETVAAAAATAAEGGVPPEVCGYWCSYVRWQGDFVRRLAAPLYAARRGRAS